MLLSISFESSVKEKDHQTSKHPKNYQAMFESSVKEKDHQTNNDGACDLNKFESSVKEKDHQTHLLWLAQEKSLRAV